jgi:DNA-binding NarL/FixJ family response regulator
VLDPYPLWADALAQILSRAGIGVVGHASEPAEALALAERHRPDVLIGEIHGLDAGLDGAAVVEAARRRSPGMRTVVVSSSEDPGDVQRALAAGATAYVFKTARTAELVLVARGIFADEGSAAAGRDEEGARGLTRRELEILRLVAEGHSNAQLARMLWVTEQTVKFHLSNIYRKLDVANRTEASRWAQVHDLLPPRTEDAQLPIQ